MNKSFRLSTSNQKGQSLVEYLVIVAFVGVASIAVMRALGANISINLANISNALSDQNKIKNFEQASPHATKKSFSNFMDQDPGGSKNGVF